jgi:hypothetical protein
VATNVRTNGEGTRSQNTIKLVGRNGGEYNIGARDAFRSYAGQTPTVLHVILTLVVRSFSQLLPKSICRSYLSVPSTLSVTKQSKSNRTLDTDLHIQSWTQLWVIKQAKSKRTLDTDRHIQSWTQLWVTKQLKVNEPLILIDIYNGERNYELLNS